MSFRDLRNFTDMMRSLGYPRLISIENFRTPNFPLVAEILVWLVERIDPAAGLSGDIAEEEDRVHLIKSASQLLALKAGLRLNPKKLYQADGYAVRELLKVAMLLYNSLKVEEDYNGEPVLSTLDTVLKVQEASDSRKMVGDIISLGATLYDLLGKEAELRELRHSKAARPLDITQVESAVREAITMVGRDITKTKDMIKNVASNESTLDSKIEKKKSDVERSTKRLQSLKKMRPGFMDEFEKVEEELKVLYDEYVVKARNVGYLENVLEQLEFAEQERRQNKQASARRIIEDVKNEEHSVASGDNENIMDVGRITAKKGRATAAIGSRNFGSMAGGLEDSDSLDDSDSELLLDGDLTEEEPKSLKDISEDDF